jgi:hypothetical protein
MKKNITNIILLAAAGVFTLAGCQDELDPNAGKAEGGNIPFAVSEMKTRTEYGSEYQIIWKEGDAVRVFCDEAEDVKNAAYDVTPDATTPQNGKLVPNENGLKWGGDDNVHNFYAVYPADESKIVSVEDGIAKLKFNLNQTATIGNLSGTVYPTTPDMTNAYMVANATGKASETSEDKPITLTFKPIMTTLKIKVQGKADNSSLVQLTGISLGMKVPTSVASSGCFEYDIKNGKLVQDNTNTSESSEETIFINLKGNNTDAVTLEGGQSIEITAFLPPVPVNSDNQVTVKVHATGEVTSSVTLGKNSNVTIPASSKAKITLPQIATEQTGNNWITPLDDNIYLTQLSIPGTHDTFTYADMVAEGVSGNLARTQTEGFDITKQLEMGIRAFDFRPARGGSGLFVENAVWFYHGVVRIKVKFKAGLESLISYLDSNPGECAVILLRHETEISDLYSQSDWASMVNSILAEDNIKNHIVAYSPDLTLKDVRGKIVILSRMEDTYASSTLSGYGRLYGWAHGQEGTKTATISSSNGSNYPVWIQDYYEISSDNPEYKWAAAKAFMDASATITDHQILVINHISGYVGTSTADNYKQNAANTNPEAYKYISGSEKPTGNLGIVLMDYVGSETVDKYTVYGNLLPQAIIDNNYKYRMLRKGE